MFLDEFPEFDRRVIESLRQPLEDHTISIARAKGSETFPAHFILVAALNPCPCGYHGDPRKDCTCPPAHLLKYQRKISGPIIDRIDMWIEVTRIDNAELLKDDKGEVSENESEKVRARVVKARELQKKRFKHISLNSGLTAREMKNISLLDETKETLDNAAKNLDLSARAYHRVIKLARTIADLDGVVQIEPDHILEAIQYRPKNLFDTSL